jgi:hypothetical protein
MSASDRARFVRNFIAASKVLIATTLIDGGSVVKGKGDVREAGHAGA